MPTDRHEAAGWLIAEQNLPVSRASQLVKISRTTWYRPPRTRDDRDTEVIGRLNEAVDICRAYEK